MSKQTITKNGQQVDCYGDWVNRHFAECAFDNDLFDCAYEYDDVTSWEQAVENMTQFAINNKIVLLEMRVPNEPAQR